ncbi:MAG: threonine synthase [Planctomycetota bacterium]
MQYQSTRGQSQPIGFVDALLTGLAPDGGLYMPESYPTISADRWRALRGKPYAELAFEVMQPFIAGDIEDSALRAILHDAYAGFGHPAVTPLVQLGPSRWVLEQFHGPTLAFKDVAMQVLGRLLDHVLAKQGRNLTLIGATSGDTGSAGIEAVRGRDRCSICILHPHGRTSEVQRRQMTTVVADNVLNLAVEGSFDDCQALVKAMFSDPGFRQDVPLSGVNSINWARVLPQTVYYAAAALALGGPERKVRFVVPSGNFGNVLAGWIAKQIGAPIETLVVASNRNDILTRALNTGRHDLGEVHATFSPSMDIQVSSNFERLLFEIYDRDADAIRNLMHGLKDDKRFDIAAAAVAKAQGAFAAYRCDEDQTLATIGEVFRTRNGYLLDPHTAVGVHAADQHDAALAAGQAQGDPATPTVVLATAHPAKFPDAVEQATGVRPPLPAHLADLYDRPEQFDATPNDLSAVEDAIRSRFGAAASA